MELFRVRFRTKIVIVRVLQKLKFEMKGSQEPQLFRTKTLDVIQHEGDRVKRTLSWGELI